jgi:hypothetical protein
VAIGLTRHGFLPFRQESSKKHLFLSERLFVSTGEKAHAQHPGKVLLESQPVASNLVGARATPHRTGLGAGLPSPIAAGNAHSCVPEQAPTDWDCDRLQ